MSKILEWSTSEESYIDHECGVECNDRHDDILMEEYEKFCDWLRRIEEQEEIENTPPYKKCPMVYLVIRYNNNDQCRIIGVYKTRLGAQSRINRLEAKESRDIIHDLESNTKHKVYYTYHLISFRVQGDPNGPYCYHR